MRPIICTYALVRGPGAGPGTSAAVCGIGTCCAGACPVSIMNATPIVPIERLCLEFFMTRRRRSAQLSAAIDPDVAVADVVGENEEDVGFLLLRGCGRDDHGSERCQQPKPD